MTHLLLPPVNFNALVKSRLSAFGTALQTYNNYNNFFPARLLFFELFFEKNINKWRNYLSNFAKTAQNGAVFGKNAADSAEFGTQKTRGIDKSAGNRV
ncbi:MAG: hypothetical protein ACI4IV_02860 [Acutalibacteraceae bacterium]